MFKGKKYLFPFQIQVGWSELGIHRYIMCRKYPFQNGQYNDVNFNIIDIYIQCLYSMYDN